MRFSIRSAVAALLTASTITGCHNKYEQQLVGLYVLESDWPELTVREGKSVVLTLEADGTYAVVAHGTRTIGTWEAGDNGDWTWIDFHGTKDAQGRVLGEKLEYIEVLIPEVFCCPEMKTLMLKRNRP